MTLEDLGNVGEFIGALGVVVSLVYLAVQIRQNTNATRANSVQELTENINKAAENLIEPKNAELYLRDIRSFATLTPEEKLRFGQLINVLVNRLDTLLEFQRLGFIRESYVEAQAEGFRIILRHPGVREYWEKNDRLFTQEVRDWVEATAAAGQDAAADTPPLA